MKFAFLFVILLFSNYSNGQNTTLTNFSFRADYYTEQDYDYDLQQAVGRAINANSTVIVEINSSGTGRLIVYLGSEKYTLDIVEAYVTQNAYIFWYLNNNSEKMRAYFKFHRKYKKKTEEYINMIDQFTLDTKNNRAMILF